MSRQARIDDALQLEFPRVHGGDRAVYFWLSDDAGLANRQIVSIARREKQVHGTCGRHCFHAARTFTAATIFPAPDPSGTALVPGLVCGIAPEISLQCTKLTL
jgi:hypothetical protein